MVDAYERWVAGYDVATGHAKGRLRDDDLALGFFEVVMPQWVGGIRKARVDFETPFASSSS